MTTHRLAIISVRQACQELADGDGDNDHKGEEEEEEEKEEEEKGLRVEGGEGNPSEGVAQMNLEEASISGEGTGVSKGAEADSAKRGEVVETVVEKGCTSKSSDGGENADGSSVEGGGEGGGEDEEGGGISDGGGGGGGGSGGGVPLSVSCSEDGKTVAVVVSG